MEEITSNELIKGKIKNPIPIFKRMRAKLKRRSMELLETISGNIPKNGDYFNDKCIFSDRCPFAKERCFKEKPLFINGTRCHYPLWQN